MVVEARSLREFRRAYGDAFFLKTRSQNTSELDRFRIIAVKTNCFRVKIDIHSINRPDLALAQHSKNARRGFGRIMEQRVRPRSQNKRSIAQIISICKNFVRDLQTIFFSSARERAVLRRKKNQFSVDTSDGARNRIGQRLVAHRHVVKRAVRFHVIRSNAGRFRDRLKDAELIDDRIENFVRLHR